MPQTLPSSAREYAAAQRQEIGRALGGIAFAWDSMTDDLDASWTRVEPEVLAVMDRAQRRVVAGATRYVPEVLAETNPAALRRAPDYRFAAESIIGTAGDGLGTDTLAYEAVIHTKTAIKAGAPVELALTSGGKWLATAAGTMLSDTGRTVQKVGTNAHRVAGWVRMLNPPSCGRCVILAGKWYRANADFDRHPGCDCSAVPSAESDGQDWTVNPAEYLDQLDEKGLAKALGSKANAQAYRDGADLNQLINAYRKTGDVRPAQVFGRNVKITTEGTTTRGWAGRRLAQRGTTQEQAGFATRITRTGPEARAVMRTKARSPRVMPESLYRIATDREDAIRLLRAHGWIL